MEVGTSLGQYKSDDLAARQKEGSMMEAGKTEEMKKWQQDMVEQDNDGPVRHC